MVQFNKMMVMLPIMFLARKLDGEDPQVVYWLRVAYACMQVLCLLVVLYTYVQASVVKADRVVYVPASAMVRYVLSANDSSEGPGAMYTTSCQRLDMIVSHSFPSTLCFVLVRRFLFFGVLFLPNLLFLTTRMFMILCSETICTVFLGTMM